MTKEQAVGILMNMQEPEAWEPQITKEAYEALQMAIDALTDQCWAPVDEVLPDTDDYLLLSLSNYITPIIGRCEIDGDGGATFYLGDYDEPLTHHDLFVNAWMPLPKPFREEERDG